MNNDAVEAVVRELDALGIRYRIEPAGKHQKIYWMSGGTPRQYTLPVTPSDHRAAMNCRAEVRRMLKADGLIQEKTIDDLDAKEANRHLFKKIKRLEAEREEERKSIQKLRDDFEAMVALMQTPTYVKPSPQPQPVTIPPWERPKPVAVVKIPEALAAVLTDYDKLEAECAENLRLPPREGYRILPERYSLVYRTKRNPEGRVDVPLVKQKSKYVRKADVDGRVTRTRHFSPEGLAKVRENIAKGRAVRLARLEAKKALAAE